MKWIHYKNRLTRASINLRLCNNSKIKIISENNKTKKKSKTKQSTKNKSSKIKFRDNSRSINYMK